ncbi:DUF7576 family protein [Halosolutus amylolyticus]|uniref:DUF7576 family protein n=1 Tax=Halosolutus amylolyticus TaxID=2932267 RepID=UPI003CCCC765
MTSDRPDFWKGCVQCGAEYSNADPPPIVDIVTDGGNVSPISFCSNECKEAWISD